MRVGVSGLPWSAMTVITVEQTEVLPALTALSAPGGPVYGGPESDGHPACEDTTFSQVYQHGVLAFRQTSYG